MIATLPHLPAYDPTDRTHRQIRPDAFEIVARHGFGIEPGRRYTPDPTVEGKLVDSGPRFRGIPEAWWKHLAATSVEDFERLRAICQADYPTFCALLLYVVPRNSTDLQPFIWNNSQIILWDRMVRRMTAGLPCFFVVLKARQVGITTFVASWHFFNIWKGQDVHALNVAHDAKLAGRIVSFFRVFHDHLPNVRGLRPRLRQGEKIPKEEVYFADSRSHIETHVAKNLDPRGNTSRFIGESEAAYYPDLESFNDALMPQLPSVGSPARAKCSMIIESTPNGQNQFYEAWEECKEPGSEFVGLFLPWFVQDDEYVANPPPGWEMSEEDEQLQADLSLARLAIDGKEVSREQMYWRAATLANKPFSGNTEAFDEAYPSDDETCFMLRSESAFHDSMRWLTECVNQAAGRAQRAWARHQDVSGRAITVTGPVRGRLKFDPLNSPFQPVFRIRHKKPQFVFDDKGYLTVWEPPEPGHGYFISADSAGGEENRDESVAFVLDLTTGHHVAEFASNRYKPETFADILVHLCLWYNRAMCFPELNGLGSVVLKRMANEWGYTNFAHEEKWDEVGVKKNKPGFYTSPRNRMYIFASLVLFVEERLLVISSKKLLKQMSTFKREGMEFRTAKKHQHDDHVVAGGLACLGVHQAPKMFMSLTAARGLRAPTAVELGLNHSPAPDTLQRGIADEVDERLRDAIAGVSSWDFPVNPMRGPWEIM